MGIRTEAGVPVLDTARTILRPHRLGDFETYAAMWAEPAVTRFIGGKPRTREESWMRFLRFAGLWSLIGYGFWAIEEKGTGRFIGEAGFHDLRSSRRSKAYRRPAGRWPRMRTARGLRAKSSGGSSPGATRCSDGPGPSASSIRKTAPR
jgi:hypothetical protein